ncbi:DnaT-like ssDNA-binding protein [Marispirochaeta aestuarii]|uniref:DnaT-like ssDNA-binding protein n=1 Tax=Marispirochaeta aestuarii TaxID=1963862 RepID=UPI002ABD47D4|nr:DnaT-like ssDNA-binding protein [Marispirochaeta aestuarii]
MALIVEDGTGLPDAQSYISVTDADVYHAARGNSVWVDADQDSKEASLILATEYLDGKYGKRWLGTRLTSSQALDWPRTNIFDELNRSITGVPEKIANATAVAALKVIQGEELNPDLERGGKVRSESVGPISTEYEEGAPGMTYYSAVHRLISRYIRPAGLKVVV